MQQINGVVVCRSILNVMVLVNRLAIENWKLTNNIIFTISKYISMFGRGRCDRMVVGFTTTYAINAYHH